MKLFLFVAFSIISICVNAQALRDINYNYLYSPDEPLSFFIKPSRSDGQWQINFQLHLRDTALHLDQLSIKWETRTSLSEKQSQAVFVDSSTYTLGRMGMFGKFNILVKAEPEVIVARVIDTRRRQAWFFYQILEPKYPVNYSLQQNGRPMTSSFVSINDDLQVNSSNSVVVSYYDDNFPVALPPFAEAQGRVSKGMGVDSTFTINGSSPFRLGQKGLYLLQRDTSETEGVAVRAEDDFPKLSKISSLAGPMVYICTKQEYDRLSSSKVDKKQFDRVILGITNDTDRARKLIRNYFRRVEFANQQFTSYKEGWKTDRGMMYIVFGQPDEVYKFQDREVWYYSNGMYTANFTFLKTPSLFDPENYVLIRDKKFQQTWYEVIDLWRNARF